MKPRGAAAAVSPSRAVLDVRRPRSRLRRWLRDNGLSLALLALFALSTTGQMLAGHQAYNADQREHGQPEVDLVEYVRSDHFAEATAENWESEFLQMAAFIWLTAILVQRGSAESRDPDGREPKRSPPPPHQRPWPVRRGGIVRRIYEHSLGLAFALLFVASFWWHAAAGAAHYSAEQRIHGGEPVTTWSYVGTAQFWFESFQNWQSEFLAILSMTVLSIVLRQTGSPESKEVESSHGETGK
jgi:hypothetical protein